VKRIPEATTGVTAAGASSTPVSVYGEWLLTHGIGVLSYAEIIQLLGAAYVLTLLLKMMGVFKLIKWIYRNIK